MTLVDAVKLALIYRQIPPEMLKAYTELVENTSKKINMEDAKSVRFENDRKKFASVCNKNSEVFTVPNPLDHDSEVEAVSYAVVIKGKEGEPDRVENGRRYMYFSNGFTEAFSVRVFATEEKFNKFKHYNRISVIKEFEFRGAQFLLYKSKDSNVERVAIYCSTDCDLTPNDLAAEIKYATNFGSTSKTSVFG